MEKMLSPIQFIGTQRSGSNLLRVMLNQLSEISAPHPPHILKTFFPLIGKYGNLEIADNFRALINDVCEWVNLNPVPWEGIVLNPDEVFALCKEPGLLEVFRIIYELKAKKDGAVIWCCKSMETVHYVHAVEASSIKPIYLHIYRDGRDVAVSFLNAIVGPKHIYFLAKKWRQEQELSLKFKEMIPAHRFISVCYEDLISQPERELNSICQQIGVKYRENLIMDYFHSKESVNTANSGAMWKNLSKPILKDNHHKFLTALSKQEIQIFESVAGDMLVSLGYERLFPNDNLIFLEDDLNIFEMENAEKVRQSLLCCPEADKKKRMAQEAIYQRIVLRG
jgi:hypothetical protein